MVSPFRNLSATYKGNYQRHLEAFKRRLKSTFPEHTNYTDFYPSIGVPEGGTLDLLVYGQAVGGWHRELDFALDDLKGRAEESRSYSNKAIGDHSPLEWVNVLWSDGEMKRYTADEQAHYVQRENAYRAHRSFFWQVTTKLLAQRHKLDDDRHWTRHMVWSNLYKIAPQWWEQKNGVSQKHSANPTEADRILQRPECIDLVRMELKELRPKACIVLTNDAWWSHFRRGLHTTEVKMERGPTIDSVEDHEGTRIVVTKRGWGVRSDDAVRDIAACLAS